MDRGQQPEEADVTPPTLRKRAARPAAQQPPTTAPADANAGPEKTLQQQHPGTDPVTEVGAWARGEPDVHHVTVTVRLTP
jgi:hypothetical protein